MKIFKYRVLNHIIFWILIYSFYSLPSIISSGDFASAKINLTLLPFDIFTVYVIIGFLMPRFLFRNKFFPFILGTISMIGLNIAITQYFKYNIHPLMGFWIMPRPLTVDLFYALLTNFMIVGMAVAMKLFSHSNKMQIKQAEFERRSAQSELGVLRSQVNPHFLFNVLNNIDALIFENKEKASNAIFLLSRIMRFMLQESSEEQVMLDKELNYIKDYLELAKLSFEDDLFLEYKVTGDTSGKMVPPLLFIPIIENAVKHCNKQSSAPGIAIKFTIDDKNITLETSNFLKSSSVKIADNSTGTGLKNVKKRLAILYKENYTFKVEKTENKFHVYLKTPLS